jgi:hypothetical protein
VPARLKASIGSFADRYRSSGVQMAGPVAASLKALASLVQRINRKPNDAASEMVPFSSPGPHPALRERGASARSKAWALSHDRGFDELNRENNRSGWSCPIFAGMRLEP